MIEAQQKFFHTIGKDGQIEKQGMVLNRDPKRMTVEFFSWLTGLPNGQQTFYQADAMTWRFYDSEAAWKHAGDKEFS